MLVGPFISQDKDILRNSRQTCFFWPRYFRGPTADIHITFHRRGQEWVVVKGRGLGDYCVEKYKDFLFYVNRVELSPQETSGQSPVPSPRFIPMSILVSVRVGTPTCPVKSFPSPYLLLASCHNYIETFFMRSFNIMYLR